QALPLQTSRDDGFLKRTLGITCARVQVRLGAAGAGGAEGTLKGVDFLFSLCACAASVCRNGRTTAHACEPKREVNSSVESPAHSSNFATQASSRKSFSPILTM